ncbi:MAG: universal stress protein [Bacteroidetes bacterium]|nr:universal stress protein [Bacteroidota bacterium]
MKNILVTIDFSEQESLLVDKALEIATAFKSKVWVLHIAAPDPDFVGYGVGPQYIRDSRAEELRDEHRKLQEYASRFTAKGIEAEGLLIQGSTIEMVMAEAEKLNIDLIIVGRQEHGFLYKAFVGSVSAEIIKESKIPVLIVPLV